MHLFEFIYSNLQGQANLQIHVKELYYLVEKTPGDTFQVQNEEKLPLNAWLSTNFITNDF